MTVTTPRVKLVAVHSDDTEDELPPKVVNATLNWSENAVPNADFTLADKNGLVGDLIEDEDWIKFYWNYKERHWPLNYLDLRYYGGVEEPISVLSSQGEFLTLQTRAYGRCLLDTKVAKDFGLESDHPSLSTVSDIVQDIISNGVEKILGTDDPTGYSLTSHLEETSNLIRYLYAPFQPSFNCIQDLIDQEQALRGAEAPGLHWIVLPTENAEGAVANRFLLTTVNSHAMPSGLPTYWPKYWAGTQEASTIVVRNRMIVQNFHRQRIAGNLVVYSGALRKPGNGDACENSRISWGPAGSLQEEPLTNGDFEHGGNPLYAWNPSANAIAETEDPHGGNYAVHGLSDPESGPETVNNIANSGFEAGDLTDWEVTWDPEVWDDDVHAGFYSCHSFYSGGVYKKYKIKQTFITPIVIDDHLIEVSIWHKGGNHDYQDLVEIGFTGGYMQSALDTDADWTKHDFTASLKSKAYGHSITYILFTKRADQAEDSLCDDWELTTIKKYNPWSIWQEISASGGAVINDSLTEVSWWYKKNVNTDVVRITFSDESYYEDDYTLVGDVWTEKDITAYLKANYWGKVIKKISFIRPNTQYGEDYDLKIDDVNINVVLSEYIELSNDDEDPKVGLDCLKIHCFGAYPQNWSWFWPVEDAGWDLTKWGGKHSIPVISFWMKCSRAGPDLDELLLALGNGDGVYSTDIKSYMGDAAEWSFISLPVGPYCNPKIWSMGTGADWRYVDFVKFINNDTETPTDFWLDGFQLNGRLIRGAKKLKANGDPERYYKMLMITDDVAKDDSGTEDDSYPMAQLCAAELYRNSRSPWVGSIVISAEPSILPGQIAHIHGRRRADGSYRTDMDMRMPSLQFQFNRGGVTCTVQLTNDLYNGQILSPMDLANIIKRATNPDFQTKQITSIKTRDIDISQPILWKNYQFSRDY